MKTDLFDYDLPDKAIATHPIMPRELARLMCVAGHTLSHHQLGDLPTLLRAGDLIIFNDSRVIPARLLAVRERELTDHTLSTVQTKIDLTLHKPVTLRDGDEYPTPSQGLAAQNQATSDVNSCILKRIADMPETWRVFARPGKKLRPGDVLRFADDFYALLHTKLDNGEIILRFNHSGDKLRSKLHQFGTMPLPPYIRRSATQQDSEQYQTIFAKSEGSVAAPTAGLHI
ncbi:MAG: S-adenosylmethionine:tRNA ribosyltransferase-isomerase, partial [Alphaproteobacteria bacterium]|nr:S-adenosylmethionine:tRNA ribosyltransferase-isomerase [Alphaproteobacteria bacterium]